MSRATSHNMPANASASIIGGGPAGLMAAEILVEAGVAVDVYEAMPTLGRKFLRAGLGGLNITHSEPYELFCKRYGDKQEALQKMVDAFKPGDLREWVHGLGIETFVGTSGRVFPKEMKAAPLLRAWVHRLRERGVRFHMGSKWVGFADDGALIIESADGELRIKPGCIILALGGGSWPQLGSTGAWLPWLAERGIKIAPLLSANCGFDFAWSALMREKFPASPLKSIALTFTDLNGKKESRQGELLIKEFGIEGSLIYAFSRRLRETITACGEATFYLDLVPGKDKERVLKELSRPRGSKSLSRHLQTVIGDDALKRTLLFELVPREKMENVSAFAQLVKALPITIKSTRPIAEAISTAGGVCFESLDDNLMLKSLPGVFVAGEMLDWEAPTGGYLLTACFATGKRAALGAIDWLEATRDK